MTFVQRHAYGFGCGLAAVFWPLFRRRRRISVDNLLRGGVASDEAEARRIAKRAFCHFLGHMCEALCVPGVVTKENWRDHLDCSEADPTAVKALLDDVDRPVLLVSGHHGCWEAATNIISFARPMIAVARVMDSKLLQNWIKKHHFRGPVTIVNKNDGFTKGILEQWQRENAAMTILMDQYSYGGAKTQFFGRRAPSRRRRALRSDTVAPSSSARSCASRHTVTALSATRRSCSGKTLIETLRLRRSTTA